MRPEPNQVGDIELSRKLTKKGIYVKRRCQRPVQKVVRLTGIQEEILNREGSAGFSALR